MSDAADSTEPEKRSGLPPFVLILGFLAVATVGSAFVVLPDNQAAITTSSTLVIPGPGSAAMKSTVVSSAEAKSDEADSTDGLQNSELSENHPQSPAEQLKKAEDELQSKLLVGEWRQDYYGVRTLSIKADGTATMTIIPSSLWAVAFGAKIDLTMFWSVKDGYLDYGITGGTPADKVQLAAKTWGDKWVEKIIELNENKLDLLSVDGTTHSIWERAPGEVEANDE